MEEQIKILEKQNKRVIPSPEGLIAVIECVGTPLWGDTTQLSRWKTKIKSGKLNEGSPTLEGCRRQLIAEE